MVVAKAERLHKIHANKIHARQNRRNFFWIISGVSDWEFMEIEENKCEGMVYIKDIEDDKYYYMNNNKPFLKNK